MPKNPNSPPWETNREITLVNAQDLDYVEAKADEYSTLLIELARKGEMTVTESVAKVHYPMDGDMIIKKIFLVLVREGILTGPDGRLRNYTIDAVWVSKKIKEAVEEEKNRKEEEGDEEGEDEEGEEEKTVAKIEPTGATNLVGSLLQQSAGSTTPTTSWQYDGKSGYYFDASKMQYYDPKTKLYFCCRTNKWLKPENEKPKNGTFKSGARKPDKFGL